MNYFTTTPTTPMSISTSIPQTQTQTLVTPIRLNDEEKKKYLQNSKVLVSGYHTPTSSRGRGRRGRAVFPSPQSVNLRQIYRMVKTYERTTIVSGAGVPAGGAYNFDFNSVNDSGSLTLVFDQYRIAMVEITFLPDNTNSLTGGPAPPLFATAVDLDDSTSITVAQIGDYPNAQVTQGLKEHKHTFVPQAALATYSGTFTSYTMVRAPWIDVASPAVYHYGVKYAFSAAAQVVGYEVRVRLLLEFQNVR